MPAFAQLSTTDADLDSRVAALLQPFAAAVGVHLDVGGRRAGMAVALGPNVGYVAIVADEERRAALAAAGLEIHLIAEVDACARTAAIRSALADRRLVSASICAAADQQAMLASDAATLRELLTPTGGGLVVEAPVLALRDAASRLLAAPDAPMSGRGWTGADLTESLAAVGWHETQSSDRPCADPIADLEEGAIRTLGERLLVALPELGLDRFVRLYRAAPPAAAGDHRTSSHPRPVGGDAGDRPFLTIVTRTTGARLSTLRTTLMSIAGQTCNDFEVILVVHSREPGAEAAIRALVAEFPDPFVRRVEILRCEREGRAAPLNAVLDHFAGRYLCVLDDDDFVFGNWIEVFRDLAQSNPGMLVRATCVDQIYRVDRVDGVEVPRATSWFQSNWPDRYDALAHLHHNETPFMSVAFPRHIFTALGMRWDETLTTTEDWQFLVCAAMQCGVADSPEITCVYRRWSNGQSSTFLHTSQEWRDNHQRIVDELDSRPIRLPAGSVKRIGELLEMAAKSRRAEGGQLNAFVRRFGRSMHKRIQWLVSRSPRRGR